MNLYFYDKLLLHKIFCRYSPKQFPFQSLSRQSDTVQCSPPVIAVSNVFYTPTASDSETPRPLPRSATLPVSNLLLSLSPTFVTPGDFQENESCWSHMARRTHLPTKYALISCLISNSVLNIFTLYIISLLTNPHNACIA